ncbi:MAG: DUF4115 domain-containing protein [Candidatus Polarisedimenticolaceae bacterium]|nr:DUF4115 domain-containing protein [Candidatus Polarisedimenticolaceae bacterium]
MSKNNNAESEQIEEQVESIGLRLKRGREAKGLLLSDVVKQLNLSSEIIEALESDDTAALPSAVFVQGYLRSYAKIIDIDAEPLIEQYRIQRPQFEQGSLSQPSLKREVHSGHGIVRVVSWTLGLGMIALMVLWWVNQGEEMLVIETTPVVESPLLTLPKIVEVEAVEAPPVIAAVEIPIKTAVASAPVAEDVTAVEISEPVSEPVEAVSTDDMTEEPLSSDPEWKIVIEFSGPCWVNIKDAEGRGRIVGNMEEGTVHTLEGPAPYSVVLGNASAVTMRIDGQLIDLSSYSRGNVARFTLDPAEFVAQ